MKTYELTFLFKQQEEAKKAQKQINDWVKDLKGKVLKKDNWGVKDLAYKIEKEVRALYLFFEAKLPGSAPTKVNEKVNLSENILRHLIVVKSEARNPKS